MSGEPYFFPTPLIASNPVALYTTRTDSYCVSSAGQMNRSATDEEAGDLHLSSSLSWSNSQHTQSLAMVNQEAHRCSDASMMKSEKLDNFNIAPVPSIRSSVYNDPNSWAQQFQDLTNTLMKTSDFISMYHDNRASLNSRQTLRHACCVRILPSLDTIKTALKRRLAARQDQAYDMFGEQWGSVSENGYITERRGAHREDRKVDFTPTPTIWSTDTSANHEVEITVFDAFNGEKLMRITEPKLDVAVTSLLHAPFRGFMDRQLNVLPIRSPPDLLRLKSSQILNTDYVWVGFQDGTIRLFPANHHQIRNSDLSHQFARRELTDLVFELPKYHAGSIVSIIRSPCHNDGDGVDLITMNRVSSAVQYMTAATSLDSETNREHLSLMCTASVDSSVVIWDVRKIYQALESMRMQLQEAASKKGLDSASMLGGISSTAAYPSEVIHIECLTPAGLGQSTARIRSTCTLVKVRPLLRLKGNYAGLKSIQWVSSLISAGRCTPERNIREMTRSAEEQSACATVKSQRLFQAQTQFDKREVDRYALGLSEKEMQDVEKELEIMLPPLMPEPVQTRRVNLIIAGDSVGTIHIWNLDEELQRKSEQAGDIMAIRSASEGRASSVGASSARSRSTESAGRESVGSTAWSTVSPSVQLSAIEASTIAASKKKAEAKAKAAAKKKKKSSTTAASASGAALHTRRSPGRLSEVPANSPRASMPGNRKSVSRSSVWRESSVAGGFDDGPVLSKLQMLAFDREVGTGGTAAGVNKMQVDPFLKMVQPAEPMSSRRSGVIATPVAAKSKRAAGLKKSTLTAASSSAKAPAAFHTSVSPSRAPAARGPAPHGKTKSVSPGRNGARKATKTPSPQRSASAEPNEVWTMNDYLSRSSKCRIEFTDSVSITGMTVDLPPHINTTLRRIPNPKRYLRSVLEQPTDEEAEQRMLENQFDDLTEDKALFFAFQQLQLYVCVEGAVLNLRCLPRWILPDGDGRTLFKTRTRVDASRLRTRYITSSAGLSNGGGIELQQQKEKRVEGSVDMAVFQVYFSKRVLEVHSQPVTNLSIDWQRRHIRVARNDGFLSVFSMDTKDVITRLPHPCADAARGPPNLVDWQRQQDTVLQALVDGKLAGSHLEWHKESKSFPASHFTSMIPFCSRTQTSLLMLSDPDSPPHLLTSGPMNASSASSSSFQHFMGRRSGDSSSLVIQSPEARVSCIDGRSDLNDNYKGRELRLAHFLVQMQRCRIAADTVRHAQREYYGSLCRSISGNVSHVIGELGAYSALPLLRQYYHMWRDHMKLFRHQFIMRRQRSRRLQQTAGLARLLEQHQASRAQHTYFLKWLRFRAQRRSKAGAIQTAAFFQKLTSPSATTARVLPTEAMMRAYHFHTTARGHFMTWLQWLQWKRRTASPSISASRGSELRDGTNSVRAPSPFTRMSTQCYLHPAHEPRQASPVLAPSGTVGVMEKPPVASQTTVDGLHGEDLINDPELPLSVGSFLKKMRDLLMARTAVLHFSDRGSTENSVMDESWMSILESAESAAEDSEADDERRYCVFRFALVPLLLGLTSTADDVLPNLYDPSVAQEVLSMLVGILICTDYVTCDAEMDMIATSGEPSYINPLRAAIARLKTYALRTMEEDESTADVLQNLSSNDESLHEFLDFAKEHATSRRLGVES